jgi:hypothetical protein
MFQFFGCVIGCTDWIGVLVWGLVCSLTVASFRWSFAALLFRFVLNHCGVCEKGYSNTLIRGLFSFVCHTYNIFIGKNDVDILILEDYFLPMMWKECASHIYWPASTYNIYKCD